MSSPEALSTQVSKGTPAIPQQRGGASSAVSQFRKLHMCLVRNLQTLAAMTEAAAEAERSARAEHERVLQEVLNAEGVIVEIATRLASFPKASANLVIASDGYTYEYDDLMGYIARCQAAGAEPLSANDQKPIDTTMVLVNHTYRDALMSLRRALLRPPTTASSS